MRPRHHHKDPAYPFGRVSSEPCGRGGSAIVYRARNARRKVAIKVYKTQEEAEVLMEREARAIQWLPRHANLVELQCIVGPGVRIAPSILCPHGALVFRDAGVSLRAHPVERTHAWRHEILRQLHAALCHMHAHLVTHGDIKPDNILLRDREHQQQPPHVTLIDFGYATILPYAGALISDRSLSPEYAAPELIEAWRTPKDAPGRLRYDPMPADVWSLGCVGYFLFNHGRLPTDDMVRANNVDAFIHHRRTAWPWPRLPEDAGGADHPTTIMDMLHPNPARRPVLPVLRQQGGGAEGAGDAPTGAAGKTLLTPGWTKVMD